MEEVDISGAVSGFLDEHLTKVLLIEEKRGESFTSKVSPVPDIDELLPVSVYGRNSAVRTELVTKYKEVVRREGFFDVVSWLKVCANTLEAYSRCKNLRGLSRMDYYVRAGREATNRQAYYETVREKVSAKTKHSGANEP